MFTEVSVPHRCSSALSCFLQGNVRHWLQWEEVKPRQVAEPCKVWGNLVWVRLLCLAGSRSLKDVAGGERELFSVSLVIAGCLM